MRRTVIGLMVVVLVALALAPAAMAQGPYQKLLRECPQNIYYYTYTLSDGSFFEPYFQCVTPGKAPGSRAGADCAAHKRMIEEMHDRGEITLKEMHPKPWDGVPGSYGELCYLRR